MTTEISNMSALSPFTINTKTLPPSERSQNHTTALPVDNIIRLKSNVRNIIADQVSKLDKESLTTSASIKAERINSQNEVDIKRSITQSFEALNNRQQSVTRKLEFKIDEKSGRTVITVRDFESKDVIRQIPSEQALEISRRLNDLESDKRFSEVNGTTATGILFSSKT